MAKLDHFLNLLTRKEKKRFLDFLHSPFFNKDRDLATFYEDVYLKGEQNDLPKAGVSKKKNKLINLLYRYLIQLANERVDLIEDIQLLRELNFRNENKFLPGLHEKVRNKLKNQVLDSEWHYELRFKVDVELNKLLSRQASRQGDYNLHAVRENLAKSALLRELRYGYLKCNLDRVQGVVAIDGGLENLINRVNDSPFRSDLLINLYSLLLMTLVDPNDESHFASLMLIMDKDHHQLSRSDAYDLYAGMINYCIRNINLGNEHYKVQLLNLFKQAVGQDFFVEKGKFTPFQLKNMVSLAAGLQDFQWTEFLIDKFASLQERNQNSEHIIYNQAVLAYHQGAFRKAGKLLYQVAGNFEDAFFELDARVYQLKAYFELGEIELAESACHAFRLFLYRYKKISPERKSSYRTFIRLYRRLCFTDPRKSPKWDKLEREIEEKAMIAAQDWLLEKVKERNPPGLAPAGY